MTGVRILSGLLFALAWVLILGAPAAVGADALGDPGPALLPRIVGVCMALLAVALFAQHEPVTESNEAALDHPVRILLSLVAIPVFYLMFEALGYTASVALYLMAAFCFLGPASGAAWLRFALAATAFSLASGLVFSRLLDLPLPGVIPG